MYRTNRVLVAALALLVVVPAASAAPIASYDFTGSPGTQASEPVDAQPLGATFGDIVRGPGLLSSAAGNAISSSNFTLGGVLDASDYYGFTITVAPGFALTLDSIEFSERRSGTGIRNIAVRSSLDGFSGNLFTAGVPDDTLVRRQTIPLGPAFAGLTGLVEFRIYGFLAEAAGGTWRLGGAGVADNPNNFPANLLVNGSITAIPEPATLGLFGLGAVAIGWVGLRRRTGRA